MLRIASLFLFLLLTLSCSNELEYRTTAFQGTKNYISWLANDFQATFTNNGGVKIIGIKNNESVTLKLSNKNEGIYLLDSSSISSAIFNDADYKAFSTLNNGDGEIVVEEFDEVNLTITGTFKFNSYTSNGEFVNFINGIFYKVPILSQSSELAVSNSFNVTVNSDIVNNDKVESIIIDETLHIVANQADNSYIEFFIPENIEVGSYTLNASGQTYANYGFSEGAVVQSQYGTLTIFEHDIQFKKIKASFLFNTGHPHNIEVTNGNFIVYY